MRTQQRDDKTCGSNGTTPHWCEYCQQWECDQCSSSCVDAHKDITELKFYVFDCNRILFSIKVFLDHPDEPVEESQLHELKHKFSLLCNSDKLVLDNNDVMKEVIQNISERKFNKKDVLYAQSILLNVLHQIKDLK